MFALLLLSILAAVIGVFVAIWVLVCIFSVLGCIGNIVNDIFNIFPETVRIGDRDYILRTKEDVQSLERDLAILKVKKPKEFIRVMGHLSNPRFTTSYIFTKYPQLKFIDPAKILSKEELDAVFANPAEIRRQFPAFDESYAKVDKKYAEECAKYARRQRN